MTRPANDMTIAIDHDLDGLQDTWRHLAAQTDNVFATWEWATTWWRHFGRGRPMVFTAEIDGEIRGLLPLYRWRARPLRIVRFIGHGPADQLGPISSPSDLPQIAATMRDVLAGRRDWDIFLADVLPGTLGPRLEPAGIPLQAEASPFLDLAGQTWGSFLAGRSSHFRQQLSRRERKLAAAGRVSLRMTTDPATLSADLDALFALHRRRWSRSSEFSRSEPFHREFAAIALEKGWLRLWILDLDDRPVAAWYGFRYGSAYSSYQGGRDPSLPHLRLGTVLIVRSIEQAIGEGAATYRFLRGGEQYKFLFAGRDDGLTTIGVSRTAAGAVALRSYHALLAVARRLRRGSPAPSG